MILAGIQTTDNLDLKALKVVKNKPLNYFKPKKELRNFGMEW